MDNEAAKQTRSKALLQRQLYHVGVSLTIYIFKKGEIIMSNKKVVKENWKEPKGNGPGSGTWGVKGSVANKVPKNWGRKGVKSNSNNDGKK